MLISRENICLFDWMLDEWVSRSHKVRRMHAFCAMCTPHPFLCGFKINQFDVTLWCHKIFDRKYCVIINHLYSVNLFLFCLFVCLCVSSFPAMKSMRIAGIGNKTLHLYGLLSLFIFCHAWVILLFDFGWHYLHLIVSSNVRWLF